MKIEEVKPAMASGTPVQFRELPGRPFTVIEYQLKLSKYHPIKKRSGKAFYHELVLRDDQLGTTINVLLEDVTFLE